MVHKSRAQWLAYMLGYMTSKGWRISKEDAQSLKDTFPEVPKHLLKLSIKENTHD